MTANQWKWLLYLGGGYFLGNALVWVVAWVIWEVSRWVW